MDNKKEKSTLTSVLFDIVSIVATAAVAVGLCFVCFFRTIQVSGESMLPTLDDGEQVILQSIYTKPQNGDVVVTAQPNPSPVIEDVLIKRVIATAGQTVKLERNADGVTYSVYVDDVKLDEPYIKEPVIRTLDYWKPVTVPEGYVYVMGDNRNNSSDSRSDDIGMIREEYIMGKVLYSVSSNKAVK